MVAALLGRRPSRDHREGSTLTFHEIKQGTHPYHLSRASAVSATRAASTRVMQRWSMGHSRFRHGLHSTGSRTTRASGPVGPVAISSVAPKIATVGTPSAEAMCIAPESLVKYTRHAAANSINSASEVSPAKFLGRTPSQRRGHGRAQLALLFRSENRDRRADFPRDTVGGFREPLRQPALGRSECRARAHADHDVAQIRARETAEPASRAAAAPSSRIRSFAGIASMMPARRSSSR